jgi:hypothetical protein
MHADHITGLGALRDRTHCITVMGEQSGVDVVSMRVSDGDTLQIEGVSLDVIYTPGHPDDSYSFHMQDRVFTGDTLLIRGTGRTDFQNGDPRAQYESIFRRLLRMPDETLVYPAHDYKGDAVSTIGEERAFNPRLPVKSMAEYVDLMNGLHLPNPKMMDVAIPANMRVGLPQEEIARRGWAVDVCEAMDLLGRTDVAIVDLREPAERDNPRGAACSIRRAAGEHSTRRHATRAGDCDEQAAGLLLRVRRTLSDGGSGGAGCRVSLRLPHPGRDGRVEEGWRFGDQLSSSGRMSLWTAKECRLGISEPSSGKNENGYRHFRAHSAHPVRVATRMNRKHGLRDTCSSSHTFPLRSASPGQAFKLGAPTRGSAFF